MKKGKAFGIGIAVIAVTIVMGIASLPDEVLLESPKLDTAENLPSELIPIDVVASGEVPTEEQPLEEVIEEQPLEEVIEEQPLEEVIEEQPLEEVIEEAPQNPDDSEGQIIEVNIRDGVGSKDR